MQVESESHITWRIISKKLRTLGINRTSKQCKERWLNHLNPSLNREDWKSEEIYFLFMAQKVYGNNWSLIAQQLPHRSVVSLKNVFYSTVRRNIRKFNKNKTEKEKIRAPVKEVLKDPELMDQVVDFTARGIYNKKKSISRQFQTDTENAFSGFESFIPGLVSIPMPPLHAVNEDSISYMDNLFQMLPNLLFREQN